MSQHGVSETCWQANLKKKDTQVRLNNTRNVDAAKLQLSFVVLTKIIELDKKRPIPVLITARKWPPAAI